MPPLVEPLDLDVAQKHAIAAATAAFARSHAQEALERKANCSLELGRSKSTASRKSLTSQGSHFPPRELVARSVPARKSIQTSSPHRPSAASATEESRFFDPAPVSDRPTSATRPLSAQPSITFSDARPGSQPRSHRQSAASSVASQQIRKARSMYYASNVQTGSPIARPPAKYLTKPPPVGISLASSATPTAYVPTRSTGPSPLAGLNVTVPAAPNDTIDIARDKYLQDFQQQPRSIKHKPSLFLAPFKKRQVKTKDKAKRLSAAYTAFPSNNYSFADDTTTNLTVSDFMLQVQVEESRSFSGSLKKKIKRVFRRTSTKTPNLPVQQIEASREYFNETTASLTGDRGDIHSPEEHLLKRLRSRSLVEEASTPPIDPKRMFSALRREIDASKAVEDLADKERTPGAESNVFESGKTKKCDTYSRRLGRNNDAFSNADRDASSQGKGPLADTFEREFDSSISTRD
ncbi:hypothetical protein N0V91_009634 [Didymella pomorum]|uniref:Uncharacterized protein n=1 Tax=Didymella pomorum TaxID=749634 RepID=A0A9W8Z6T0_9PLEO|nr:hypothetical protein N0V91_009634 [Didymella pomorum]